MVTPIIEFQQLTKAYGMQAAVDHLSLNIEKGEIFGLLGPNGAGKSTTILMLLGLTEPDSGSASVAGINATRHPLEVKQKVGYLPDDIGFYDDLSGRNNLIYTAQLNGITKEEAERRADEVLIRVGLQHSGDKKAGAYSRGMRQRLGLADVLIKNPEIIILDEPTLGVDPEGVREFLDLIQRLSKDEGLTVLLSSHHLHQVQQVCDRVGLFVKGRLLAVGKVHELAQELFNHDPLVVQLAVENEVDQLSELFLSIKGVTDVKRPDNGKYDIYCRRDLTADIADTVLQTDSRLVSIHRKDYGLNEIYHRYFEGGDVRHGPSV